MDLKSKVICLIVILNIIFLHQAFAFFKQNDRPDNLRIEHTPIDQSTQGNVLYLYDNFISDISENYITKKIENFIFADQIKINLPMNILMQDSIYPENSIDRMMLANLRAKKLFDEYSELQKKVRSMLQGDMNPGKKKDEKKSAGFSMDEAANIDEKIEAIQKTMSNIYFLGHLSKEADSEQNQLIFEHLSPMNSDINEFKKNAPDIDFPNTTRNYEGDATAVSQKKILNTESHKLPWVFSVLLKLLSFIISNKFEIMIYMLVMTIVIFLISFKIKN